MDTELAGRGCSIRWPGLALWALGSTHRAQEKFGDQEPGRESTLQTRRTVTSGRRRCARCPLGFLLPAGIRSQRVKVALPASSLFLQVSDIGPTHESPFRFCPQAESSYCCFPAPACHLIRKFLLDTGSREDFSDISRQMLTESSAHPMLSDHTVAPPTSRTTNLSPHRGTGEKSSLINAYKSGQCSYA